ncbi:MAG: hypothetical protein EOM14_08875 [Clostridia bacterium]|nr:hypothetical protein [Clostridia bacterium]
MDKRELIELVTKEVLKQISTANDGENSVLVLGNPDLLPDSVKDKYNILGTDRYTCEEDINLLQKVYISELSLAELADIALGRNSGKTACATLSALLKGKEVWLLDSALGFRKYGAQGARALLQLYEGYVRTLLNFGVKMFSGKKAANLYTASAAPDPALPEGVVTEAVARRLIDSCEGEIIKLKKGAVITPSARDVIKEASKKIELV